MAERRLPARRKKAPKGKVVRISNLVYDTLDSMRRNRSWDSFIRRMIGLPDRAGNSHVLIEGMLDTVTGKFWLRDDLDWDDLESQVYEASILAAAKQKLKKVTKPIRLRELP